MTNGGKKPPSGNTKKGGKKKRPKKKKGLGAKLVKREEVSKEMGEEFAEHEVVDVEGFDYENNSSDGDYSDGDDEGNEGYKVGGYHPVSIGDVYGKNYMVVSKLGWGHFSTVWLCNDISKDRFGAEDQAESKDDAGDRAGVITSGTRTVSQAESYVALKILKSASHYREAAMDEIELLNCVAKTSKLEAVVAEYGSHFNPPVVLLVDHFQHTGPHGRHICMVFETLGENLLQVIKNYDYRGIPMPIVKRLARQMCLGLDFLHRHCGIIHTDLKPENILIVKNGTLPSAIQLDRAKAVAEHNRTGGSIEEQIGTLETQLESGKALSSEQKKKLKKKLKKKRQRQRKKEKGRSSRATAKSGPAPQLSPEKELQEMMMMEADSIPLSQRKKLQGQSNNLVDGEDENNSVALTAKNVPGQLSKNSPESTLLPSWLRPTLFTYLNFSPPSSSSSSSSSSTGGSFGARLVDSFQWNCPPQGSFAKFSIVTGANKIMAGLNRLMDSLVLYPEDVFAGQEWTFSIVPSKIDDDYATGVLSKLEAKAESKADNDGNNVVDPLVFNIRCEGDDDDQIANLAALNILRGLTDSPDYFILQTALNGTSTGTFSSRPMVWTISHHESTTPLLLNLLEGCVEGLRFLVHTSDLPGTLYEDDDMEMCFIMRTSSMHPIMDYVGYESETKDAGGRDWMKEEGNKGLSESKAGGRGAKNKRKKKKKGKNGGNAGHERKLSEADDDKCTDEDEDDLDSVGAKLDDSGDGEAGNEDNDDYDYTAEGKEKEAGDRNSTKSASRSRSTSVSERTGSSALLGVDLGLVADMVVFAGDGNDGGVARQSTAADIASMLFPMDLSSYVRPFSERIDIFLGVGTETKDAMARWRHAISSDCAVARLDETTLALQNLGIGPPLEPVTSFDGSVDNDSVNSASSSVNGKPTVDLAALFATYKDADIKIVDLGNACWTHKHFTDDVQTRQYRCPEVILGQPYDTSADMWSLACIIFELLTGDLMFDPHAGKSWDRDEDHLAMMIELIGPFPRKMTTTGKFAGEFFGRKGELRHIQHLKFWSLEDVLKDKYHFTGNQAKEVSDFLCPLLSLDPTTRVSAADALKHPFLANSDGSIGTYHEYK